MPTGFHRIIALRSAISCSSVHGSERISAVAGGFVGSALCSLGLDALVAPGVSEGLSETAWVVEGLGSLRLGGIVGSCVEVLLGVLELADDLQVWQDRVRSIANECNTEGAQALGLKSVSTVTNR